MKLRINTAAKNIYQKYLLTFIIVLLLAILYLATYNILSIYIVTKYVAAFRPDQCESSWENCREPTLKTIFAMHAVFTKLNISYVMSDGTAIAVARQSAINPWERVKYKSACMFMCMSVLI